MVTDDDAPFDGKEAESFGELVERVTIDGLDVFVLSVPLEPDLPPTLSRTEREVVIAALTGASNRQIAERRGVAAQTIANQLRSAFKKLGVNSRGELAARLYGPPADDE